MTQNLILSLTTNFMTEHEALQAAVHGIVQETYNADSKKTRNIYTSRHLFVTSTPHRATEIEQDRSSASLASRLRRGRHSVCSFFLCFASEQYRKKGLLASSTQLHTYALKYRWETETSAVKRQTVKCNKSLQCALQTARCGGTLWQVRLL